MAKKRVDDSLNDEGLQYNTGIGYVMRVNLILYKCYNFNIEQNVQGWIKELDRLLLELDAKLSDEECKAANKQLNNIYKLLERDSKRARNANCEYSAELMGGCREFERFLRRTKFLSELNVPERAFDTSILV